MEVVRNRGSTVYIQYFVKLTIVLVALGLRRLASVLNQTQIIIVLIQRLMLSILMLH